MKYLLEIATTWLQEDGNLISATVAAEIESDVFITHIPSNVSAHDIVKKEPFLRPKGTIMNARILTVVEITTEPSEDEYILVLIERDHLLNS